jgi:hypothetical protein
MCMKLLECRAAHVVVCFQRKSFLLNDGDYTVQGLATGNSLPYSTPDLLSQILEWTVDSSFLSPSTE